MGHTKVETAFSNVLTQNETSHPPSDTTHSNFTEYHSYTASSILRLCIWALPHLQAFAEPTSCHDPPNNSKTKPGTDPYSFGAAFLPFPPDHLSPLQEQNGWISAAF